MVRRRRARFPLLVMLGVAMSFGTAACGDSNTVANEPLGTGDPVASIAPVESVGSSVPPPPPTAAPLTPTIRRITCRTFFRDAATEPPTDGPVLTFDAPGTETADFADLRFAGLVERDETILGSLFLRVSTLPDDKQVFGGLYQFATNPNVNSFEPTGQGFTGLLYVYNPTSGSELQITCAAEQ